MNVVVAIRFLTLAGMALLAGCERPPVTAVQHGYRGTGMEQVYNPRQVADQSKLNQVPEALPAASSDGPKAGQIYKNVKVLGDLSVAEFTNTMLSITAWVAPTQGCTYCHNGQNLADDSLYTKVVARRMLQMTQHINADWKQHVAGTGVTCYTCHRGQPQPNQAWVQPVVPGSSTHMAGNKAGQNAATATVGYASLPNDPFSAFLDHGDEIRVVGTVPLPGQNRQSIKQAEWTYGLMMHMSKSLGVNCTYCHNSRSFSAWDQSSPQRATAWYGIRLVRDLNTQYLESLADVFPAERKGPLGDVQKVNCATCHQGAYKPLYGVSMVQGHRELLGPLPAYTAAAPAADAAASAPQ